MAKKIVTGIAVVLATVLWAVIVAPITYWFATIGHPTSLWLWRDVFGVL